jgi:hypothetical protein
MPDSWRNGGSVAFVELDRPDPESRTRVLCYAGHEMAKYLKWTSFLSVEHLERNAVQSPELSDAVVSFPEKVWPLLRFIGETR